jgi:hypothetical protein
MKYEVKLFERDDNFYFGVFEHSTEQVIAYFLFMDEANDYGEFLEGGGAFNGRTPPFMLTDLPELDVNDKFEKLVRG